jgi:hypothetical protein
MCRRPRAHPFGIGGRIRLDQAAALGELEDAVEQHEHLLRRPRREWPGEQMATEVVDIAGCERILALLTKLHAREHLRRSRPHGAPACRAACRDRNEAGGAVRRRSWRRRACCACAASRPGDRSARPRRRRRTSGSLRGLDVFTWPRQRRSARLIEDLAKRRLGVLGCKGATWARPMSGAPDDCFGRRASSRVADVRAA